MSASKEGVRVEKRGGPVEKSASRERESREGVRVEKERVKKCE